MRCCLGLDHHHKPLCKGEDHVRALQKALGGAAGVPVRQRMLGGTQPGAGAGPRESHIVQRCRQPGGCSQPGVSWRDSPNHPGLWRGPPSLGEGEDKAARTHTRTLSHPPPSQLRSLFSIPVLWKPSPCLAPFTVLPITGARESPCPRPRSTLPAHALASPPAAGKWRSQRDCNPVSLRV